MSNNGKQSFWTKGIIVFFGAMICCGLWGSAYPMVKIGMQLFNITIDKIASQILFAGIRFFIAGILIVLMGSALSKKWLYPNGKQFIKICKLSLFQTIGQYAFYYIGLAHCTGVNASIIDSSAYFFSILLACFAFHLEKMNAKKIIGCMLGVLGVIIMNTNGAKLDFHMTWIGEGMILLAGFFYSMSSVLVKIYSKDDNPVLLSGYQFVVGGFLLGVIGLAFGGRVSLTSTKAGATLIYLAFVSTFAYTIWSILLKYNDVSKVSIFGFMTPVFGVFLSMLILGEREALQPNYLIALIVISIGITLLNVKQKESEYNSSDK